jgi:hypothetical protein
VRLILHYMYLVEWRGPRGANQSMVARWFVFKPKIPIWLNFGGPYKGKCWYILWSFGIFYGHLVMLW